VDKKSLDIGPYLCVDCVLNGVVENCADCATRRATWAAGQAGRSAGGGQVSAIVFLDIDGVLVTKPFRDRDHSRVIANKECVAALNELTRRTEASIVLSSSWRYCGLEEMRLVLRKWGVSAPLIDMTPDLSEQTEGGLWASSPRWAEILRWLTEKQFTGQMCILDDEPDMAGLRFWHVRTDYGTGFNGAAINEAANKMLRVWRGSDAPEGGK
jgi:hypothetical protein